MATMAVVARSQSRRRMTYVRDIPLLSRQKLCKILDVQGPRNWKELAALLGFSADDCYCFEKAYYTPGGSPADEMLKVWDFSNHTVTELYNKLYQMNHARGMMLLKDLVDAAHREKIKKVQGQQPDENGDEAIASATLPISHQPHMRRQDPSAKLYEQHPSNIPPGVPNQGQVNQYQNPNNGIPIHPHHQTNREPEASAASQSSWNGAPSPGSVHNDNSTMDKVLSYNLDGGTQKQLNSPLVRPGACNFNSDGKFSNDSNPSDTLKKTTSSREEKERLAKLSVLSSVLPLQYEKIRRLTQNFSDSYKLGSGSFGTVYFMMLENTKFAVKRLHQDADPNSSMNASRFSSQMKEITSLVMYKHPNIINLTHNCTDGPEPCLVYEYMQNGSLEDNLQMRGTHKQPLDWRRRNKIALDSAKGLQYLHNIQDQPLIHGDIKGANILLDENFKPKIADFGLARYGPDKGRNYTVLKTSKAYGTMPYLPRDFLSSFKLSVKVDVYSFGIVLMEILTGEKAADEKREPKTKWLVHIVFEVVDAFKNETGFEKNIISKLCDKRCPDWPWDLAWQMLELALLCTHKFPQRRPEMKEVSKKLQEINDRIEEREALRHRMSLPTENTEPLQSGREPQESVYEGGSSSEIQQQHQDPKVSSSTPQQRTEEMSALQRKIRDMASNPIERPGPQDQSYMPNQLSQQQLQQKQDPTGYNQQYRPPPHMPQDLRSVSQDSNVPGYNRQQAGSPQQSFPTGTSSTVPSSFMNRPTPPSTATQPSTNPSAVYDHYYDDRRGNLPQGQTNYSQNDLRQYPPESSGQYSRGGQPDYRYPPPQYPQGYPRPNMPNIHYEQDYGTPHPQHRYDHYQQQQYPQDQYHHQPSYYPPPRQYSPRQEYQTNRWPYDNPPSYSGFDPMASINPEKFTAAPPTPAPPNQSVTRMEDQMRRLDLSQVPPDYMHRGPDFPSVNSSRHTPSPVNSSRHTPSPSRMLEPNTHHHEEDVTRNTSSTLQQQTSHVQFPDSMHMSHQSTESTNDSRVPIQQTDVLPSPITAAAMPSETSRELESVAEVNQNENLKVNQNGNLKVSPRQSPVPSQDTDIISTLKQLHLDGATTNSTDTQELDQPVSTVPSMNGWEGERKKPVPSQHTDKLPTRELHQNNSPATAVAEEQNSYQSAPPLVGLTDEEFSSMRSGTREPTQKTEPLVRDGKN